MPRRADPTSLILPANVNHTLVTFSPTALCHYITDDELERIGEMRKEPVMEICLVSIGAFIGALLPAIQLLDKFSSSPGEVGFVGLSTVVISAVTFSVSLVTGFLWWSRTKAHDSLIATIRDRPRAPVTMS